MSDGLSRWPNSADNQAATSGSGEAYYVDSHTPTCFIVDKEEAHRHYVSLALQSHGIEATLFSKPYGLREGLSRRTPDLIFLDVSSSAAAEALDSLRILAERQYGGIVQLMSADGMSDGMKAFCRDSSLRILPAVAKPLEPAVLKRLVGEHGLGGSPTALERMSLDEALKRNWVEFWYQPKIDLRKKQLAGVELFARIRHPERGILLPGVFMEQVSDESLTEFTRRSVIHALESRAQFSTIGIAFPVAVNVSLAGLDR